MDITLSSSLINKADSEVFKDILDLAHINYSIISVNGDILIKNKTVAEIMPTQKKAWEIDQALWEDCRKVMDEKELNIKDEIYNNTYYKTIKKPLIENGECKGILIFSFDINAQKQAEIAKQLFIESMGHDLRTPFGGCRAVADYLIRNPDLPVAERQEFLQHILTSSDRVLDMFNQILDIISLDKPLEITTFSTQALIKKVVELFGAVVQHKNLQLVDDSSQDYQVTSNALALESILVNLVGNAVKFTQRGSVKIQCTVTERILAITVEDTGIGIDTTHHHMIFDKFTKVVPTFKLNEHQGTGRGLYLVKNYAERLGGNVQLESILGRGSKFIVSIPLGA